MMISFHLFFLRLRRANTEVDIMNSLGTMNKFIDKILECIKYTLKCVCADTLSVLFFNNTTGLINKRLESLFSYKSKIYSNNKINIYNIIIYMHNARNQIISNILYIVTNKYPTNDRRSFP